MFQDHDEVIELLAYCYPKAFVPNPHSRFPLKVNIERDIDTKEVEMAAKHPISLYPAVNWYRGHVSYQRTLIRGAARYDLNGNKVGTVTQDDELAARERIKHIHNVRQEQCQRRRQIEIESMPMMRKNGVKLTPAPAIELPPQPAPVIKPVQYGAVIDMGDCDKELKLVMRRIEIAAGNLADDKECAAMILSNAVEVLQRVIEKAKA